MSGLRGEHITAPGESEMRIVSCPECGRIGCQASGKVMLKCSRCGTWFAEDALGAIKVLKAGRSRP